MRRASSSARSCVEECGDDGRARRGSSFLDIVADHRGVSTLICPVWAQRIRAGEVEDEDDVDGMK